ncbi:MAG: argininosuccinate lyase [Alphaproteobacteria bacterium]|jgi:argininosuccinate lyase|nr:argininosuccinate lyase [Alphaproteobacteria bacterium]|tara:strand:+ start:2694 stop:4106 length:1413 start_codon:yes stop_codon:yes gene_type:complete
MKKDSSEERNNSKIWGGRFSSSSNKSMEEFNSSIQFDKKLYKQDIEASIVHAEMLCKQKIISEKDFKLIKTGLNKIKTEISNNNFTFSIKLEDIHMNIENRLVDLIGDAGKKLHTGRSRNDQVATDIKLWLRDNIDQIEINLKLLQKTLIDKSELYYDMLMPGYTHLQVAQPVTFGHHLLAYVEMLGRDRGRLTDCRKRLNESPLGSAALAGTSYPIDRDFVSKKLGFDKPTKNSMDGVSDRDFAVEFMSATSLIAIHLSRLAEELVIWSSDRFNFIKLPESFTTGSSIMPQKRNPDAAELIRAKPGRIFGNMLSLMTVLKGLPMTYGKDMQEDKEPIFDTARTIQMCIVNMDGMIKGLQPIPNNMIQALQKGFPTATDLADYLVINLDIPFRDAHHLTGRIVLLAEEKDCTLESLSLKDIQRIIPEADDKIIDVLKIQNSVSSRNSFGGTAPKNVLKAAREAKKRFLKD